jgi:hypothetical protein
MFHRRSRSEAVLSGEPADHLLLRVFWTRRTRVCTPGNRRNYFPDARVDSNLRRAKPLGLVGGSGLNGDPRPTAEVLSTRKETVAEFVGYRPKMLFLSFEGFNKRRPPRHQLRLDRPQRDSIMGNFRVGTMFVSDAVKARDSTATPHQLRREFNTSLQGMTPSSSTAAVDAFRPGSDQGKSHQRT